MPDTGPNYSLPPGYFVQSGETILPSQHNPVLEDLAAAMNARMMRNGSSPMTGNLQMGSKKITGLAAGTNPADAPRLDQVALRNNSEPMTGILTLTGSNVDKIRFYNTVFSGTLYGLIRIADDGKMLLFSPLSGSTPYYFTSSSDTPSNHWDVMTLGMSNARYMPQTWTLTAGNGLTGGGNGSDNRAVALGTPSTVGASTANAVTAGSHTHAIGSDIARSARTLNAGDGLTGGGNLTTDRTISMGTPSSITADSSNSASGNTHTHSISAATIGELMSRLAVGAIGTYALMFDVTPPPSRVPGSLASGSALRYSSAGGTTAASPIPQGTWRLMAYSTDSDGFNRTAVWMRIS